MSRATPETTDRTFRSTSKLQLNWPGHIKCEFYCKLQITIYLHDVRPSPMHMAGLNALRVYVVNAYYDAYSTNKTTPGAPVIGMVTPFNMVYHFECPCMSTASERQWRVNRVEMIADFFTVLAPEGYNWNNCGRIDLPFANVCDDV